MRRKKQPRSIKLKKTVRRVLMLAMLGATSAAFAVEIPDVPATMPWYGDFIKSVLSNFPEASAWFATIMLFLMSTFRGVAELLTAISKKTASKSDDKLALSVSKIAGWLAAIVGWFGIGAPKK
jgi:hypothetical protein